MKRQLKRLVSLLLVSMMMVSSIPFNVLAEEQLATESVPVKAVDFADSVMSGESHKSELVPDSIQTADPDPVAESIDALSLPAQENMTTLETEGSFGFSISSDGLVTITSYDWDSGGAAVIIPASLGGKKVVGIGANVFKGLAITSISFSNTIEFIADGVFNDCDLLTEIELPSSLTAIESTENNSTFGNCSQLTSVTIPQTVVTMEGVGMFANSPKVKIYGAKGSAAADYAYEAELPFEEVSLPIVTLNPITIQEPNVNTAITLTAVVAGGTAPYSYAFSWDLINLDGTEKNNNLITNANTAVFTPTEAGIYSLYVMVTDNDGKTAINSIKGFKVINEPLINTDGFTVGKTSPQYLGTEIPLKVEMKADSGSGDFDYRFYATSGAVTVPIDTTQETPEKAEAVFKPETAGIYNLYVEVTDTKQNLTTKGERLNYTIVDDLAVKSFTASPDITKPQGIGTPIQLSAEGSGGKTAYQYRFYAISDTNTETEIKSFSTASSATFTPVVAGTYTLHVEVKNGSGKIVKGEDFGKVIENLIITPVVGLTAKTDDGSPCYVDETITLTADITGKKDSYTYRYSYTMGSNTVKTVFEEGTSETLITYEPESAGLYTFYVEVKDGENLVTSKQSQALTVLSKPTVSLKSDKTSPQNRNATVKFTATATGGAAPYSYKFSYVQIATGIETSLDTSESNIASIPLIDAGNYEIKLLVTDVNGETAETTIPSYQIRNNPLATLTTAPDDAVNHYVKEDVTLSAVVDGGTDTIKYRFYYKLGSRTVEIKNPIVDGKKAEVTFTPTVAGTYIFLVEVTDGSGLKTTATKTGYTVLPSVLAKNFTADKPSGQNVDTVIKLTANGSGGKAPYTYRFYYKLNGEEKTIDEEKLPATNTVQFKPDTIGSHTLCVDIRDNNGTGNSITKTIENYQIVNGPVIENFTAVNKSDEENPTYVGDLVKLKVNLADGTGTEPVKYTFTIKNGLKTKTVIQNNDTYEFTPDSPGTYSFTVKAVDAKSLKATSTTSLVVFNTVSVSLKADKPSGQSIYSDIKLTANATGGQAPYTYEFEYDYEDETQIFQSASLSKTAVFEAREDPEKVGSYTFRVKVRDANGIPVEPDPTNAEITAYQIKNPPILESFTTDPVKGSTVYAGAPITLSAAVTEGTGEKDPLIYKFYANGKEITYADDEDKKTPETCVYKPLSGGAYTFEVEVSDDVTAVKGKITGYKVNAGVEVSSLTADKPTGLIKDDTIKLTAAGKGGVAPYSYAFYYDYEDNEGNNKETKKTIITTDAKLKTVSRQLDKAGKYTFYVVITDKNNIYSINETAKKIEVTVTDPPIVDNLKVFDPTDETKELTSSYTGDAITLTAAPALADASKNLTYTFSYKVGSKTTTIEDTDGTAGDKTATFIPPATGIYTFYVSAYDKDSTWTSRTVSSAKFTVLKTFGVKSLKTSKPSGQNVKTEIKLTATAEGGKAPYTYSFYQKLKTSETDTITEAEYDDCKIIEGSSLNNASYTPPKNGTYIFMVVITDANKTKTKPYLIDFEVTNPFIVTLKPDKPSQSVYQGDTVTLTAEVDKGGTYTYLFSYVDSEGVTIEKEIIEVGSSATVTFKDTEAIIAAGTYQFNLKVTDTKNNDDYTNTAEKTINYTIVNKPSIKTFTIDKAKIKKGSSAKLTAAGQDGIGSYQYKFWVKKEGETDEKMIRSFSSTPSYTYRPPTAGNYTFYVDVKDSKWSEPVRHEIELELEVTE